MAIGTPYATALEYRAAIDKTDGGDDAAILVDLETVSNFFNRRTKRSRAGFNVDAGDVTRIYEVGDRGAVPPGGIDIVTIDDLVSVTSIKLDVGQVGNFTDASTVTAASTDYEFLPLDRSQGPEVRPADSIRFTPWGTIGALNAGVRIEVVGKFGWPDVPAAVKSATIQLCSILRLEGPRASQQIPEDLEGAIQFSPSAKGLVWDLVRTYEDIRY